MYVITCSIVLSHQQTLYAVLLSWRGVGFMDGCMLQPGCDSRAAT